MKPITLKNLLYPCLKKFWMLWCKRNIFYGKYSIIRLYKTGQNMKKIILVLIMLNVLLQANQATNCMRVGKYIYSALSKSSKALPDSEIVKLSKMSDGYKGTKSVKNYIGKLNLPKDAQEDVYLRIAIHQKKIDKLEADRMFKNLQGKDGFRGAMSKIIGNSEQGTKGHLNELRIASSAVDKGFDVVAIGKKFDDGIKNSLTDIDVLLRKNGKDILIEAKKYASSTKMPLDKFKADLNTLNIYAKNESKGKALRVFSFTEKPQNKELLRQYKFWAKKKGVELIFGMPEQQIIQIQMLLKVL